MFTTTLAGIAWGGLFTVLLVAACVTDVRVRRIPNALVLGILASGFAYSLLTRPFPASLVESSLGLVLGFGIWIGFWLAGVMGAGDVKFFAAIGAWLGPALTWRAALAAALVGGVVSIIVLVRTRTLGPAVARLGQALTAGSVGSLGRIDDGTPARRQVPYGVAMALGALVVAWFPQVIPW